MIALSPPLRRSLVVTPHGAYGLPRPKRNGVHRGLDFACKTGDAIVTAAAGTVDRVGFDPPPPTGGGGGKYVVVSHTDGGEKYETAYMHLTAITARAGDVVGVGVPLGTAGSSGTSSSGTHLHFELRRTTTGTRVYIDPTSLFQLTTSAPPATSPSPSSTLVGEAIVSAAIAWVVGKVLG